MKYILKKADEIPFLFSNSGTINQMDKETVNKDELMNIHKEQMEVIIENMSDALIIFDNNGNITKFNKEARTYIHNFSEIKTICEFLKLIKKVKVLDLNGKVISEEILPFRKILKGEKLLPYQLSVKSKDNIIYFEFSSNPIYDEKGNFIAGILMWRDITESIKYHESLLIKTQFDLFNRIIRNLNLPVLRFSYPDLIIKDLNPEASNYIRSSTMGAKLRHIKGKNFLEYVNAENKSKFFQAIDGMISKKKTFYIEEKRVIVTGEEKFYKHIYEPLFGFNKEIVEIILFIIDITEEVRSRNQMEENLKMQEQIFANISHELKTPLNVIFSTNQLNEFYLKNDLIEINKNKICNNINIIKQNCYRFTKLINNIVDLSKIESGFFKLNLFNEDIVQITENIVQSVSQYIEGKGLGIIFDTNIEEKIIACDADKIERIILNLISNAIKFSNIGGNIYVCVEDKEDYVEISVKDTGIGMDKKYISNIFERFQQIDKSLSRNAEGSGIGLSLVKSIVELHHGKIGVESKLGEGSTFTIELPVRIAEKTEDIFNKKAANSKVEMINIEFSDIYSI